MRMKRLVEDHVPIAGIARQYGVSRQSGADLIIDMVTSLGTLEFKQRIVVQVKSYSGRHEQLDAVDQVESGIKEFEATAGLIVTTAERTEALEERIAEVSQDIDRPIELLAGDEVANFVLRHAPDKLFRL